MLPDHYLPHLFENFEHFNVYTYNTVFLSYTINRIFWLLCFCSVHGDIIMQQEPMKRTLFKLML